MGALARQRSRLDAVLSRSLRVCKAPTWSRRCASFELVSDRDVERLVKLRRSAEGRAVPLPGVFSGTDDDVALLALGFARGEAGALAVPYARRGDA